MKSYWTILIWVAYALLLGFFAFRHVWWWWGLGLLVSFLLVLFDRALYVWWLRPYEQLSIQLHYWWKRRDLMAVARLVWQRGREQTRLVHLSAAFAMIWPFLTFYILTSTASVIAAGIVFGLGLHLALAIGSEWNNLPSLKGWFCWQIKRGLSDKETRIMAGSYLLVWLSMSILVLVK